MMMKQNQQKFSNLKNHPSFQSKFKPQKPCIKVDYKVIHSQRSNNDFTNKKSGRKIFNHKTDNQKSFISTSSNNQVISRVKSIQGSLKQYESGKFIGSEYCPNENSRISQSINTCRKGKIYDAKNKYQHSKSVQNILKEQNIKKRAPSCFISESRMTNLKSQCTNKTQYEKSALSSQKVSQISKQSRVSQKSKLPSYSHEGIKDIIEYDHAGKFRQERVTPKCGVVTNVPVVKDKFRAFNQIHDFDFRKRVNTLSNQVRLTRGLR